MERRALYALACVHACESRLTSRAQAGDN
jgi:hypothetical protein